MQVGLERMEVEVRISMKEVLLRRDVLSVNVLTQVFPTFESYFVMVALFSGVFFVFSL